MKNITIAFDHDQTVIINYALYASGGLSCLGSLFIIMTYLLFKSTRSYGTRLVFFLSIADFMASFSWFPWNKSELLCEIQAGMLQFFMISSTLWTLAISVSLYQVFVLEKNEDTKAMRFSFAFYQIFVWGYSGATVAVCFYFHKFASAGPWCWIPSSKDPFRLLVYVPMVVTSIFICFTMVAIRVKLRFISSDFKQILNRRMSLYLLAFLSSCVPAIVNRVQNYIAPDHPIFILYLLQSLFQPAQGFFNSVVYGLTETQFAEHYRNWCSCCCRKRVVATNGTSEEIPIINYDYTSDEEEPPDEADHR
eukprot:TRINITY_DN12322_c0_g1_i1.p1 TRINITY_DN12322_c0_g1~~TRINITY_DN12322_c0_g1_i1.p1  ORF type:complete len:307 (-),score=10.47 TRINITY_DN12322_c0_g1_i1:71-991(-)